MLNGWCWLGSMYMHVYIHRYIINNNITASFIIYRKLFKYIFQFFNLFSTNTKSIISYLCFTFPSILSISFLNTPVASSLKYIGICPNLYLNYWILWLIINISRCCCNNIIVLSNPRYYKNIYHKLFF
jgi:hypothetical protein